MAAVLADWRTAPLDPKLRATLGFLEKLTLAPADVRPADLAPLRAAGVSDDGIEDTDEHPLAGGEQLEVGAYATVVLRRVD